MEMKLAVDLFLFCCADGETMLPRETSPVKGVSETMCNCARSKKKKRIKFPLDVSNRLHAMTMTRAMKD